MAARLTPQERQWRAIRERDFQTTVESLARAHGWLVYHAPDNRPITYRGDTFVQNVRAGFPDLVMVRDNRLVFAELKRELGKVSDDQTTWMAALNGLAEVYLWRPSDLDQILATLRR